MSLDDLPQRFSIGDVVIDPAVVLAPMEGVSDLAFRRVIRSLGGPGLTYTEFIASLDAARRKRRPVLYDLDERPIAVQIFGRDPAVMAEAAKRLEGDGASIIDINMGCPSKRVCSRSGGSALMREPTLAVEIVRAVVGAVSHAPVTVKMRSGFDADTRNAPALAARFEDEGAQAITVHWRTREDGFQGERCVETIAETVGNVRIPVVANGDIGSVPDAVRMFEDTGCAGVMIGRGAVRNPWLPLQIAQFLRGEEPAAPSPAERHRVLRLYFDEIERVYPLNGGRVGRMKMVLRYTCEFIADGARLKKMAMPLQTKAALLEAVDRFFFEPPPPAPTADHRMDVRVR
jgi:nifR3 family TIM-barrel protein